MSPSQPVAVVADLLSAPVTLPADDVERLDDELLDLLCEDETWVEETFHDIVAACWSEPPPDGSARPARPRRLSPPGRQVPRQGGIRCAQWCPLPYRRQRSPPGDG